MGVNYSYSCCGLAVIQTHLLFVLKLHRIVYIYKRNKQQWSNQNSKPDIGYKLIFNGGLKRVRYAILHEYRKIKPGALQMLNNWHNSLHS